MDECRCQGCDVQACQIQLSLSAIRPGGMQGQRVRTRSDATMIHGDTTSEELMTMGDSTVSARDVDKPRHARFVAEPKKSELHS